MFCVLCHKVWPFGAVRPGCHWFLCSRSRNSCLLDFVCEFCSTCNFSTLVHGLLLEEEEEEGEGKEGKVGRDRASCKADE